MTTNKPVVNETPAENALTQVIKRISNKDHVFDETKYGVFNLNGKGPKGLETQLRGNYVYGSAFVAGHVGETRLRILYNHVQGYRIFTASFAGKGLNIAEDAPEILFSPDQTDKLLVWLEGYVY